MLIVLVLGFIGLAIGGVYLKRYIHRRREAEESRLAGPRQDLETWGPGHSVHDINAVGPGMAPSPNEKGKGREVVQTQESVGNPGDNRRLKKGWFTGRG